MQNVGTERRDGNQAPHLWVNSVRFTYPVPGVRTLWQAVYDLEDPTSNVSFFAGDRDGTSHDTEPVSFPLARQSRPASPSATP